MTLLDTDRITQELDRRFSLPLPEYYKRRIIFWKDEDQEFNERIVFIELENAKIVILTGKNAFEVKKLLTVDDTESNFLVYCPVIYQKEKDPLLPIELYSEEFHSDLISIWLDEMKISNEPGLRNQVKSLKKFFNTKPHREKVCALNRPLATPIDIALAAMAVCCGMKTADPASIIIKVLGDGLDKDSNKLFQQLVSNDCEGLFWKMIRQACGYQAEEPTLKGAATSILLSAASRTMMNDQLSGLENYYSADNRARCYDLVSAWQANDIKSLHDAASIVEDDLLLPGRFEAMPVEDLVDTSVFPCVNVCILRAILKEIDVNIINVEQITAVVEKRRTCAWYSNYRNYYEGIQQIALMQKFYMDHAAGFHTLQADQVWHAYTEDYYHMDTFYRQFHVCFAEILKNTDPALDDLFKQAAEKAEGLYSNWYLSQLGTCWANAAEEELKGQGYVNRIERQTDFYSNEVKKADSRVFVIISDAMRYEVAASLKQQLQQETTADVKLKSCQAIFPTITKFGMAALLPHWQLSVVEKPDGLHIFADGMPTDSNSREVILQKYNSNSITVKLKDLIEMKAQERDDLFKGQEVIYIYHDKIDETGHSDEKGVFPACSEAIAEIKNCVRQIVNAGGVNIIITSDHGFLYTYKPLQEDSKLNQTINDKDVVELDRRYLIAKTGSTQDYMLPIKFLEGTTSYEGFAPRESIRIKKKGGGLNFVHGGISLQEMVVPVIEYHYLRNQYKKYQTNKDKYDTKPVALNLLSVTRKIGNMLFSLNFYQADAVGPNREKATYNLYFTDSEHNTVSDMQTIIADKTSKKNEDRTFKAGFNLKSMKYDPKETYYLVIKEITGKLMPQEIPFTIDIAFATDDFDFFK